MQKNLLSLNSNEAKRFFLKNKIYSSVELPPYFVFNKLLSEVNRIIGKNVLTEEDLHKASKHETINHILYGNKDGKYAWRKFEIINPLVYLSIVNEITKEINWKYLKRRFINFQQSKCISCESIPVVNKPGQRQNATQISHWVEEVERKSISLSLEYNYIYETDITDCYGSIYTHSLPWAIHGKSKAKLKRGYKELFGNRVDKHIQALSFGQTNGIPQGSVLMDFIAELVLGYADQQLDKVLKKELRNKKFHILRYRDDYRIFVNDVSHGDIILKCLSQVLLNLGFRLNINKTLFNNDIVTGSVKKDKLESLNFDQVPRKFTKAELFRHLLIVQQIGKRYPNSGTLKNRLSKILDGVIASDFFGQEKSIIGLLIDIGYNNPITFPFVAILISKCMKKFPIVHQKEIIKKIQYKIGKLANAGLLEIWVQRMAIDLKFQFKPKEKLCQVVNGNKICIFNLEWVSNTKIKKIIKNTRYIDKKKISKPGEGLNIKEVQIFGYN